MNWRGREKSSAEDEREPKYISLLENEEFVVPAR
jgi:hypothetical protein